MTAFPILALLETRDHTGRRHLAWQLSIRGTRSQSHRQLTAKVKPRHADPARQNGWYFANLVRQLVQLQEVRHSVVPARLNL